MSVYLDGATLSALLFSFLNSGGSQYGFLIGEKIEHIEDRISDSQILTHNVSSYIYISSFVPWPSEESIYSREGHFREEWVKRYLSKTEHTLVGWYSFRHNTSPRPSLREITLHNNLSTSEQFAGQASDFLFFLCSSSFSSNMSTHTSTHGFMRKLDGHFVPVPMSVMNLGDTTRKEYKKRNAVALSHCKTVQESFHSFRKGFLKASGESEQIAKMSHLATSINRTLMAVHGKVFESEAALGLLETDISILRQRLGQFDQEEIREAQRESEQLRDEARRDEARRDEARRKQSESKEQEQLDKLLIDLGISSSDTCVGASYAVPCLQHTASFPVEPYYNKEDDIASFQVVDLFPSAPLDRAFGSRNKQCASGNASLDKQTKQKQRVASRVPAKTCEVKRPQTVKDKVSEAFSFLDEEIQLNKVAASHRQDAHLQVNMRAGTGRVCIETGDKEHETYIKELGKTTGQTGVLDLRRGRATVVKNCPLPLVKDMTDNLSATCSGVTVGRSNGVPH